MLYLSRQLLRCNERGEWALPTLTLKLTTKNGFMAKEAMEGCAPQGRRQTQCRGGRPPAQSQSAGCAHRHLTNNS